MSDVLVWFVSFRFVLFCDSVWLGLADVDLHSGAKRRVCGWEDNRGDDWVCAYGLVLS